MASEKKAFDYFILSPLILLAFGILSIMFMPVIPVASGYGWDGVFYGKVAMNFPAMIGSMDSYHSGRIVPGVFIYCIYTLFNLPLTVESALRGYQVYYLVVLVLSAAIWVRIANLSSLGTMAKWISFCALFVNYPALRLQFYYPPLTDGTAFLAGFLMLYSYMTKNSVLLLAVSIVTFFCWPTAIVIGLVLFVYMHAEKNFMDGTMTERERLPYMALLMAPFVILLLYVNFSGEIKNLIVQSGLDGKIFAPFDEPGRYRRINAVYLVNSIINAAYIWLVYRFTLKTFDFRGFMKYTFAGKTLTRLLAAAALLGALVLLKRSLYDPNLPTVTFMDYFKAFFTKSVRFPAQFVVCHISYWGPVVLVAIVFFREFLERITKCGLPVIIGFVFTVYFTVNTESRPIINFYPFMVLALMQAVDFSAFRRPRLFMAMFVLVSVIYSKVWMPINLPASVYPDAIWNGLDRFPMQWHFMNLGLWINAEMFCVHAAAAVLFLGLFYRIIKKPVNTAAQA